MRANGEIWRTKDGRCGRIGIYKVARTDFHTHVFAIVNFLPILILPLRPQYNNNALLTPSFAGNSVPALAYPSSLCPFHFPNPVWLSRPKSHIRESFESCEELFMAIRSIIGRFAWCKRPFGGLWSYQAYAARSL